MDLPAAFQAAALAQESPLHRTAGLAIVLVLAALVTVVLVSLFSPTWRRRVPRVIGLGAGIPLAIYLVVRGIAEFWVVDYSSPASYQNDWGGPSLAGVFAVHSGPGLIILIATALWLRRRGRNRHHLGAA